MRTLATPPTFYLAAVLALAAGGLGTLGACASTARAPASGPFAELVIQNDKCTPQEGCIEAEENGGVKKYWCAVKEFYRMPFPDDISLQPGFVERRRGVRRLRFRRGPRPGAVIADRREVPSRRRYDLLMLKREGDFPGSSVKDPKSN